MTEQGVKIENVVASANIGSDVDLTYIASRAKNSRYDRSRFPGVVYRTEDLKVSVLIFGSGKIVCTGAKSEKDIREGLNKAFEDLKSMGIKVHEKPKIKVQNIVATSKVGQGPVNLNYIAEELGPKDVEYEPEIFPGLVYKMKDPEVAFLIFGSGKIVITGCTKKEVAEKGLSKLMDRLESGGVI